MFTTITIVNNHNTVVIHLHCIRTTNQRTMLHVTIKKNKIIVGNHWLQYIFEQK